MNRTFWVKRFLVVAGIAIGILTVVELLKGHEPIAALEFGVGWGSLASVIFTATRIYRSRKGQYCALCNDTPELK